MVFRVRAVTSVLLVGAVLLVLEVRAVALVLVRAVTAVMTTVRVLVVRAITAVMVVSSDGSVLEVITALDVTSQSHGAEDSEEGKEESSLEVHG